MGKGRWSSLSCLEPPLDGTGIHGERLETSSVGSWWDTKVGGWWDGRTWGSASPALWLFWGFGWLRGAVTLEDSDFLAVGKSWQMTGGTVIKKVLCCHQQPIYSYGWAAALLWSGTETVGSFKKLGALGAWLASWPLCAAVSGGRLLGGLYSSAPRKMCLACWWNPMLHFGPSPWLSMRISLQSLKSIILDQGWSEINKIIEVVSNQRSSLKRFPLLIPCTVARSLIRDKRAVDMPGVVTHSSAKPTLFLGTLICNGFWWYHWFDLWFTPL